MRRRPRRPTQLKWLILLEGINSMSLLLWGVLFPILFLHVSQVFIEGKLVARFLITCVLSVIGFIVTCGLWMQRSSAFRMGVMLATLTLALALFWIIVSLFDASFDLAPLLIFILNALIISFFLQPAIAGAMSSREKR
jgi:hypothetical protein